MTPRPDVAAPGAPTTARRAALGAAGSGRAPRGRRVLAAFATLLLFTELAPDAWRDSVSWPGYLVLGGLLLAASIVVLAIVRPHLSLPTLPRFLLAFLAWATLSIAWSAYPGVSVIAAVVSVSTTLAALALALCLTGAELVTALSRALTAILGLSLVFELVVALVVRRPIVPFFAGYEAGHGIPQSFYWSRDLLLAGGRIQGIVGNANLLGMIALLALVVAVARLADGLTGRAVGIARIVLALAVLALTRSSTVTLATAVVAVVAVLALALRRRDPARRTPVYAAAAALAAAAVVVAVVARPAIEHVLGRSSDLTGRTDIWAAVWRLTAERPILGWGWTSYWAPWVEPFRHLAVRRGTTYLQAHDAWLDVWFQLGIVGLVLFVAFVASALWRAWFVAVDRRRVRLARLPWRAVDLLPLLVLTALLAQSVAESRMLVEGGWLLTTVIALRVKRAQG